MSAVEKHLQRVITTMAPVIELSQIAVQYTRNDMANATRLVRRLVKKGDGRSFKAYARRRTSLELLADWKPETQLPLAGKVSWASRQLWHSLPVKTVRVFAATAQACRRAGVPVARIKRHQIGHDLAVCDLALWFLKNRPKDAAGWRGETMMAHTRRGHGEKLPDAFIVDADENVRAVCEICTGYRTDRIREFMEDCRDRQLPFEIWC